MFKVLDFSLIRGSREGLEGVYCGGEGDALLLKVCCEGVA